MSSQPTARTRARRRGRRREIVDAAAALARDRGGASYTTEELAAACDVSHASLFYYFKGGRQEIETALALRHVWALFERIQEEAGAAPDGVASLVAMVRSLESAVADDEEGVLGAFARMMQGPWPEELVAEHVAVINETYDVVEERLAADRAAGRLSDDVDDLRRYTMMVTALALGQAWQLVMIKASGGTTVHARARLFDDLVGLIERGTRAGPPAKPSSRKKAAAKKRPRRTRAARR